MTKPVSISGWVVSPGFDLFLLANVSWPILLILALARPGESVPTEFWQIYFLTTPHRWLTLALVLFDPDRRDGKGKLLAATATILAIIVGAVWIYTGDLLCLPLIDYLWNGWHFASQHGGVLRLYSIQVGGAPRWLERHALRWFIFYAIALTAAWSVGWLESMGNARKLLWLVHGIALCIPMALLYHTLRDLQRVRLGLIAYVGSVALLYGGLILSVAFAWRTAVIGFTAASATFHAIEYLAIVSHYAWRRGTVGSEGIFRRIARNWTPILLIYAVMLGAVWATLTRMADTNGHAIYRDMLIATNLWASFVHYAWDGIIWKLRRPATAEALAPRPVQEVA